MGEGAVRARAAPVQGAALSVTASPRIGLGETIQAGSPLAQCMGPSSPSRPARGDEGDVAK